MKKEFLREKGTWKVTFSLPKKAVNGAREVVLVGDFNDWDVKGIALEAIGAEVYETTLELNAGCSYQFRYLIDNHRWENDWQADQYIPSPFNGVNNSVVILNEIVEPEFTPMVKNGAPYGKEALSKERITEIEVTETPSAAAVDNILADDLTKIEGIGKKLEEVLNAVGIKTYKALSKLNADDIKAMLITANPRYKMHNPTFWAQEAALAAAGKWDELQGLQAEIKAGKKK